MKEFFSIGSSAFDIGGKVHAATIYQHEDDLMLVDDTNLNKKAEDANPSDVMTKPERWIKEKGRVGEVADRFFSPNFSKLLLLAGIVLMFFSPLGIIFGAVAATISISMLIYETVRDTNKYRNLVELQEKRALLEEMGNIEKQIQSLCKSNPKLAELHKLIHNIDSDIKIKGKSAAKKNLIPILERIPEGATSITAAAISLNPLALGAATTSTICGTWASHTQKNAYWRMKDKLIERINNIDIAVNRKASIAILRMKLEARQHQLEIFQKLEKECQINPNLDVRARYQFLISDHHQPLQRKFVYPPETSFFGALSTILQAGNKWTTHSRLFTPMINNYGHHYTYATSHTHPILIEHELEKDKTPNRLKANASEPDYHKQEKGDKNAVEHTVPTHQKSVMPILHQHQNERLINQLKTMKITPVSYPPDKRLGDIKDHIPIHPKPIKPIQPPPPIKKAARKSKIRNAETRLQNKSISDSRRI